LARGWIFWDLCRPMPNLEVVRLELESFMHFLARHSMMSSGVATSVADVSAGRFSVVTKRGCRFRKRGVRGISGVEDSYPAPHPCVETASEQAVKAHLAGWRHA